MSFFFDQKFLPKIWLLIVVLGVVFFHFFSLVRAWSLPAFFKTTPQEGWVQSITLITPQVENKESQPKEQIAPVPISQPVQQKTQQLPSLPQSTLPTDVLPLPEDSNAISSALPQLVPEAPPPALSTADFYKEQILYEQEQKKIREDKLAQMAKTVASETQINPKQLISNFNTVKVPASRTLKYKLQAVNFVAPGGAATLNWIHESNGTYQLNFEATAAIVYTLRWNSQGGVLETGLAPTHFTEKRFRNAETAAHFDYENQWITFSKKEGKTNMMPGAQDRFSVVVQLASVIAADPERFKTGQNIVIQVANSELAEAWVFNVQASESMTLSGRNYETLRLQRQARKPYDAQLELWLAKEIDYMPIRIRQTPVSGAGFDAVWMGN